MSKTYTKAEIAAEVTRIRNGELPREQSAIYAEWMKLEDSWRQELDPEDIVTFDEVGIEDIIVHFYLSDLLDPPLTEEEYNNIIGSKAQLNSNDGEQNVEDVDLIDAVYAGIMAASLPYESGKADQQEDYIPILAGAFIEKGLTQTQAEDMIDLLNEVISRLEDGARVEKSNITEVDLPDELAE